MFSPFFCNHNSSKMWSLKYPVLKFSNRQINPFSVSRYGNVIFCFVKHIALLQSENFKFNYFNDETGFTRVPMIKNLNSVGSSYSRIGPPVRENNQNLHLPKTKLPETFRIENTCWIPSLSITPMLNLDFLLGWKTRIGHFICN